VPVQVDTDWQELAEDVAQRRIAGAVFVADETPNRSRFPSRQMVSRIWMSHMGAVELDYVDLVRQGVSHLVARGCRRIGLMQWMDGTPYEKVMCEAFRTAPRGARRAGPGGVDPTDGAAGCAGRRLGTVP